MFEWNSDFDDEEFLESIASNELPNNHEPTTRNEKQIMETARDFTLETANYEELSERNQNTLLNDMTNKTSSISLQMRHNHSNNNSAVRKFPGPAGVLPERRNAACVSLCDSNDTNVSCTENKSKLNKNQQRLQTWQSMLESVTWKKFLNDFEATPDGKDILNKINIKHIKEKASARLLVGKKVPFLAAILQEIDLSSSPDPFITLCDSTGFINGVIHRDAWKQFGEVLIPSCVLIMRNIGVLSLGIIPNKNQHYINITPQNLSALYTSQGGTVKATSIIPFNTEDILYSLKDWISNTTALSSPLRPANQTPLRLFESPVSPQNSSFNDTAVRNLQFSPQVNLRMPQPVTPLSAKNKFVQGNHLNKQNHPRAHCKSSLQSPMQHELPKTVYSSHSTTPSSRASIRDTCTILNLLSQDENNELCQPSTSNSNVPRRSINQNTGSASNNHNVSVTSKNNNVNRFCDNPKVSGRELKTNNNSIAIQPAGVTRCQDQTKFSFNFSPKRARTESEVPNRNGSNIVYSSNRTNSDSVMNSKELKGCDIFTNVNNNSSCHKEIDDQWEVETILSSIDTDSFFEEDF